MKLRLFLFALGYIISSLVPAQTTIFTENWTGGGTGWNLNVVTGTEGADPNFWKIADDEGGNITPNLGAPGSCGSANNGDNTLFITSVANPNGGAAYDAGGLCGLLFCPQSDRRTESPLINCTGFSSINLTFNYIENGQGTTDNATVWFNDGTGWVQVDDPAKTLIGCGSQGLWVSHTVALPASANNNPNVQIAFRWVNNDDGIGTDPSFAVDNIALTGSAALPVVSISPSPNDSLCQNSTLTLNGSATNGPITGWAWTANPNTGVTFNPSAAVQNPTVTFTTPGTYTFTLQAANGSGNGSTTQVITILAASTPSVSISASPANPVCVGATVNFTATASNSGSSPSYVWNVNGAPVGSNSPNFSSSSLNNNDVVSVTVTTSDSCFTTATASGSYTVQISAMVVPTVVLAANDTSICAGTTINFTATPTNGGSTPAYSWQVNGNAVGANSPNYSSSTLANGDTVVVTLNSSFACASPATATDTLIIQVTNTVSTNVIVSASSNTICAGAIVSFTATPSNGGTTPVYQWELNGTPVGSNSPNYSSSSLANGDTVAVTLTSNAVCATPSSISDTVFMVVNPVLVPSVTITPNSMSACSGSSINFTATPTNGGSSPVYQWLLNGVNAGANANTFTLPSIASNATVSVILTSNAVCVSPNTASSNTVIITVAPTPTLAVSQTYTMVCPNKNDTLICVASAGSTFTWTPAGGLNTTSNDTVLANNSSAGSYTYYVTATLGACSATDSVVVNVGQTFTATAGPAQTICFGGSAHLSVSGGTNWDWTPGQSLNDSTLSNPVATPTATTTYSVIAMQNGCTDTVTQTVTVIPNAGASFNTNVIAAGIPQTVAFSNTSSNATGYYWTLGNGYSSVLQTPANQTYNSAANYTVTLIAYGNNGCNDTISTVLTVADTTGLTTPNVFTPNGDEINDVWQPSAHNVKTLECTIYNRWGIKVYEFLGPQDKWDGHTTAGIACEDGTYFYVLKATDTDNTSYNFKGYIQLIR